MQCRRRDDYVRESRSMRLQDQDQLHLGPGRYDNPRREGLDRSPHFRRSLSSHRIDGSRRGVGIGQRTETMDGREDDLHLRSGRNNDQDQLHLGPGPPGRYDDPRPEALGLSPSLRRSLSPHIIDGSRHGVGLGQRMETMDSREDDWHLRSGRNNEVRLRSPSYELVRRTPHLEEVFLQKDHRQLSELRQIRRLSESSNVLAGDAILDCKQYFWRRHDDLRTRKEKEITDGRWSDDSGQKMTDKKLLDIIDDTIVGSYSSCLYMGPTPTIYEDSGAYLPSSRSLDVRSLDNDRLKFQNPVVSDKLEVKDYHKVEERHRFHSRHDGYPATSGFYNREHASSSLGTLTKKSLESYQSGQYYQITDDFSRSHEDLMDPVPFNSYGKRTLVDAAIDLGGGKMNLTHHQQGANSLRREHGDYFYPKSDETLNDSHGYQSGVMQKIAQRHDYIDNDCTVGSDHEYFSGPEVAKTGSMKLQNAEDLSANHKIEKACNHYSFQKQTVLDYPYIGPTAKARKHDGEYAGMESIQVEVGKRLSQAYELSHTNSSQYCQELHARSDYDYEREVGLKFLKERWHRSPMSKCEGKIYGNTRGQRMTEGVGTYKLRDETLKRKYCEEDTNLLNHRLSVPCEYAPSKVVDLYKSDEEWIDDDMSGQYISREARVNHNDYRKSNNKYVRHELNISDDLFSRESYSAHARQYKNGPRFIRDKRRHGPSSLIESQKFDSKNRLRRLHKVWEKTEQDNDCVHMDDDNPSNDSAAPAEFEPYQDSEEFKQKVHEAFLKYSKKLNMKPGVRKRYKEQGNAGSLYCIVCGLSSSKEYTDTRRLVKHACMSNKVGSRAKHLGLVKAICVLVGWNSVIPQEITTWVPEVLPESEVLLQKEDLILWPPLIVIRNISLSQSNTDKWRVVTIEALESFLRSKGLLKGRVKMHLGRPSNKSVIVLKFLPTFSGLTDAERLHKFFYEKKHGRADFQLAKCKNGKSRSSDGTGVGTDVDEIEEKILYGYMGIADDLDEVDINIKKSSLIKSKKEILEL